MLQAGRRQVLETNCSRPTMAQVYDVSDFVQRHPGGRVIMTYAGRDATDVFSSFHAASSWALLKHMCIGALEVCPAAGA